VFEGECLYNDCLGVCGGIFILDECGICNGNAGYVAGSCYDCAGIPDGSSYVDVCGICVGGNTGLSDTLDIGIDASYLKIASRSENNRIPVNASNVGSLNSFYMELYYDSTDIQIEDFERYGDTDNDNYSKLVHYETISAISDTSFNKRVIFNLIYSPNTNCSDYNDDEEVCKENNVDCYWNENNQECEQNQFINGCGLDSTAYMLNIELKTKELETGLISDSTSIKIHNLVLNDNPLDNITTDWGIIISEPDGCGDDDACNYNPDALFTDTTWPIFVSWVLAILIISEQSIWIIITCIIITRPIRFRYNNTPICCNIIQRIIIKN
jgi:hypothetical protein